MAFIPVPNVALARLEGTIDGQQTINTQYWEISGGGITPTNLNTLATALLGWFRGTLALQLAEDWNTVRVTCYDLTTENSYIAEAADSVAGGVASEATPNNVAACVSFRTGIGGRSFRGRNFLPAVPGSVVTLNTISPTWISNILTAYGALIGAGDFLAGWQWGVASRYTGGAPRVSGIISPVTAAIFVNPYVKSMRTREVGKGS